MGCCSKIQIVCAFLARLILLFVSFIILASVAPMILEMDDLIIEYGKIANGTAVLEMESNPLTSDMMIQTQYAGMISLMPFYASACATVGLTGVAAAFVFGNLEAAITMFNMSVFYAAFMVWRRGGTGTWSIREYVDVPGEVQPPEFYKTGDVEVLGMTGDGGIEAANMIQMITVAAGLLSVLLFCCTKGVKSPLACFCACICCTKKSSSDDDDDPKV